MGTAAGFGQTGTGQQTGVGASPSTSGQTQPTGSQYGGKGGGLGLNPYAPQRQDTSTAPQQAYLPMGGTAFGYNMQRLAQRMDPSSTLPGEYQPPQPQQQQPQYQQRLNRVLYNLVRQLLLIKLLDNLIKVFLSETEKHLEHLIH